MEKPSLTHHQIVGCLNSSYGIEVTSLAPLSLGADMSSSLYKAQTKGQACYFVKLRGGLQNEVNATIVKLLHEATLEHVIPPLKTRSGSLSQKLDDFTLYLYPFMEGKDGLNRKLTEAQWIELGKTLKQVHEFKIPHHILPSIRRETYPSKWREAVCTFENHMTQKYQSNPISQAFLSFLKLHWTTIQRLVERAKQLCQQVKGKSPEFVLCHSDIHAGNVLIDEKERLYLVDWDQPMLAPKERDLMFIGGGVANMWNDPEEEANFYKGYGETALDRTLLSYYRYERIVEDIAVYVEELLVAPSSNKDRSEMFQQFTAMFEPRGVIEIAFTTDEAAHP